VSRDTSFYYSFLVLPPRKRNAVIAVWDFCRAVDDAVDEEEKAERAAEALVAWRAELAS
jgi:phytoene synthase